MARLLTMKAALKRCADADGKIVWHLENEDRTHRLTGLAWTSQALALTDERLPNFPGYAPYPFLSSKAVERRWATGPGRAGGDVRIARTVWTLTEIAWAVTPAILSKVA